MASVSQICTATLFCGLLAQRGLKSTRLLGRFRGVSPRVCAPCSCFDAQAHSKVTAFKVAQLLLTIKMLAGPAVALLCGARGENGRAQQARPRFPAVRAAQLQEARGSAKNT